MSLKGCLGVTHLRGGCSPWLASAWLKMPCQHIFNGLARQLSLIWSICSAGRSKKYSRQPGFFEMTSDPWRNCAPASSRTGRGAGSQLDVCMNGTKVTSQFMRRQRLRPGARALGMLFFGAPARLPCGRVHNDNERTRTGAGSGLQAVGRTSECEQPQDGALACRSAQAYSGLAPPGAKWRFLGA